MEIFRAHHILVDFTRSISGLVDSLEHQHFKRRVIELFAAGSLDIRCILQVKSQSLIHSLKLTAKASKKIDGPKKRSFPFGVRPTFRGELAVSFGGVFHPAIHQGQEVAAILNDV